MVAQSSSKILELEPMVGIERNIQSNTLPINLILRRMLYTFRPLFNALSQRSFPCLVSLLPLCARCRLLKNPLEVSLKVKSTKNAFAHGKLNSCSTIWRTVTEVVDVPDTGVTQRLFR